MQNLYDILGVGRNASNKEINAALRQLVRRYNEETAQGSLDSAEALKFVNHARITFADPQRRAKYDTELVAFEAVEAKLATEKEAAAAAAAAKIPESITQFDHRTTADRSAPVTTPLATEAPAASAPVLAQRMTTPEFTLDKKTDPLAFGSIIVEIPLDKKTGRMTFVGTANAGAAMTRDLGAVLSSTKAKQRSTAPNPGLRLAARIVDYGLWGIVLALILNFLSGIGILSSETVQVLTNPFVAPIIITLSWAFVEALLLILFPVTPGKLLFDVRVTTSVSNPYASNDPSALLSASFSRAFRVWWRGVAGGIAPIYLFTLLRARKKLLTFKETTWDFDSDCLVTHGKMGVLNAMIVGIALSGVVAVYAVSWAQPFYETVNVGWHYTVAGVTKARETWKILRGDLPTYGKEIPPPPLKENRTLAHEKTAQDLIDKRDWKSLSEHCLSWTREDERNATAWFCYGRARHELADYPTAITALKRALLIAPQNDDIRQLLKNASLIDMQQKQMRKRAAKERPASEAEDATERGVPAR